VRNGITWIAGLVLSGCVAWWAASGDQTREAPTYVLTFAVAFAAYVLALWSSRGLSAPALRFALGLAILWRVALVGVPPLMSDDVYRYVWEGRIQQHGGNPYLWTDRPEAERWVPLRDATWQAMNHKGYTAFYPAFWALAVRAVVAVHDSVAAMKVFVVLCELATWLLLARLLALRGKPPERLLVLAWSPLAIAEIAGGGHNDPLGLLLVSLALSFLETGRPLASALFGALAFQTKLAPGLAVLAWARRFRPWHAVAAAALGALVVVPYIGAGYGLLRSLSGYGQFWRFNQTLFVPIEAMLGAKYAPLAAGGLVALTALLLARARVEPVGAGLATTAAILLLSPSVLPWYATWLLPWLVLRDEPGSLYFTGSVSIAYLVYPGWLAGGAWQIGWGLRALEYLPCFALSAFFLAVRSGVVRDSASTAR
jgi:hypothetical protein